MSWSGSHCRSTAPQQLLGLTLGLWMALWLGLWLPSQTWATQATPADEPGLTPKEAFMLMFGKGNGAMRLLCALQKEGAIDQATRIRLSQSLPDLLSERGDTPEDRRNVRIGMAFADARAALCPTRVMGHTSP